MLSALPATGSGRSYSDRLHRATAPSCGGALRKITDEVGETRDRDHADAADGVGVKRRGVLEDLVLYGQHVAVAGEVAAGLAAPTRQRYTASLPAASTTFATSRHRREEVGQRPAAVLATRLG